MSIGLWLHKCILSFLLKAHSSLLTSSFIQPDCIKVILSIGYSFAFSIVFGIVVLFCTKILNYLAKRKNKKSGGETEGKTKVCVGLLLGSVVKPLFCWRKWHQFLTFLQEEQSELFCCLTGIRDAMAPGGNSIRLTREGPRSTESQYPRPLKKEFF